MKEIHADK